VSHVKILTPAVLQILTICHLTATKLQAGWKGYSQKSKYQKLRISGEESNVYLHLMYNYHVKQNATALFVCCLVQQLQSRRGGGASWPGGGHSADGRLLILFAGMDCTRLTSR